MTDYSKLSDFEINKAVAIQLGMKPFCETTGWQGLTSEPYVDVIVRGAGRLGAFNPCNNPSDAWPIIFEDRIAIIPDSAAGEWVAFNEFTLYEGDWMFASDPARHVNGKNPLRAAMIVYLMMKESENG